MSAASASTFHRWVVDDVIKSMRAEFANEGLDDQVLDDLKQLWESKLIQTSAYDIGTVAPAPYYDAPIYNQPAPAYYPEPHALPPSQSSSSNIASISNLLHTNQPMYTNTYLNRATTGMSYVPHPSVAALRALNASSAPTSTTTSNIPNINSISTSSQPGLPLPSLPHTVPSMQANYGYDGKPQPYMPPPASITGWNTQPTSNTQYIPNIRQHDGASDEPDAKQEERRKIDTVMLKEFAAAQKKKSRKGSGIPQFDGVGDRKNGDDLDDEDEDDDESVKAEGEAEGEELNSSDDEADDNEPDTEHIVLCQYEKVTRVKNKRKANLKDGIMHINGRDYVFSKATGEFEW